MMHDKIELDDRIQDKEAVMRALSKAHDRLQIRTFLRNQAASRDGQRWWYVIRHSQKSGESLAQTLNEAGIETFRAVDKRPKRVGRANAVRIIDGEVFPNYLFVRTIEFEAAWLGVMTFDGISGFVMNGDFPVRVSQKQMDEMLCYLAVDAPMRKHLFYPNELARIVEGSFHGFNARVLTSENSRGMLKAEVDIFGRATVCDFGVDMLRLLD